MESCFPRLLIESNSVFKREEDALIKKSLSFESYSEFFSCAMAHNKITGKEVIPSFSGSYAHGFLRK